MSLPGFSESEDFENDKKLLNEHNEILKQASLYDDNDDDKNQLTHNASLVKEMLDEKNHEKEILQETIDIYIQQKKLGSAISLLRLQKDASQGITSYYTKIDSDLVLFRDATNQYQNQNDTHHNWAILGINYAAAAINLLESHGIPIDENEQFSKTLYLELCGIFKKYRKK